MDRVVTMPVCNDCGSQVTYNYARVFGDNENEVHGCLHCQSLTELRDGQAAVASD